MNKLCYRLVFNKIRGVLMAVAETVSANSKNPGTTHTTRTKHRIATDAAPSTPGLLRSLTLQLGCAWGLVLISSSTLAQIMPDKTAPADQQAHILRAPNGTLLVNIQTPSQGGISRNTYRQFDVPADGVILNNARTDVQTQLGGWVPGNPYLANGMARAILNEINSSDPSHLRGYIEVAGSRAQVIIANPAGITCDGCGFINASRATLTTGVPVIKEGSLESYRVQRGSISVNGAGMDATRTDYTDLIARSVQINGALWAQHLKLTTGSNAVNAEHTQSTPIEGLGAAPAFALDVAYLGGMYAGKIMLVGSEAGLGVRNAGDIGASAGEVVITTEGRLENAGRITSTDKTQLMARDGIDNSGTVYAHTSTTLSTQGDIHNSGILAAQGDLILHADGSIHSDASAVLAAGMRANGSMTDQGILVAEAGKSITAQGINLSGGDQYYAAQSLALTDSQTSAANVNLFAAQGDIDLTGATVFASQQLTAESSQTIHTDSAHVTASSIRMAAQNLSNRQGEIVQSGEGALTIELAGGLDNTLGLIAATRRLTIEDTNPANKTLAVTNTGGILFAGELLRIDSKHLSGDGQLLSQGDLAITLDADYHHTGTLQASGNAIVQTAGILHNESSLSAGASLQLEAAQIHNDAEGQIQGTTVLLAASSEHALINRGLIDGQDIRIESATIKNLGTGRIYGEHIAVAADTLINAAEQGQAPVIAARERLDIGAKSITNEEHALLFSVGDMAIGGVLDNDGLATGQATTLNNRSATIEALGELTIAARQINNTNDHLLTGELPLSSQVRTEYAGSGSSNRYLEGTPDVYVYNDESDHLHTPEGNFETWWRYTYNRSITETTIVQSDPGQLLAGGNMRITADTLNNDNSRIIAGGNLIGTIGSLNNNEASGKRTVTDLGTVSNFWRDHHKGRDSTGGRTQIYAPPTTVQSISLKTVRYEGHTAPAGSGLQVGEPSNPAVNGAIQVPTARGEMVRSGGLSTPLPNNSLFRPAPDPTAAYLIETDPAFASYRRWLSSDYLLQALAVDPALTQKRLGDGFYEQRLVREQIGQLTGRRFLDGYASDEAQYQGLMSHAVTFAQTHQLRPGIALTADQMAQLTSDIIWLVEQTVTLPNGETARVLVPQLYVHVREDDLQGSGTLIAGNNVKLTLSGELANAGTIAGRRIVSLTAENVRNLGGEIRGVDVGVSARTDLDNIGGRIKADNSLSATAGRDLTVASTLSAQTNQQGSRTNVDRVAGLYVSGNGGTLVAAAGHDLRINGAAIVNAPIQEDATIAPGTTVLTAGHNLTLDTVTESNSEQIRQDKNNYRREASQTDAGSVLQTQGSLQLQAGNDLTAQGASVTSEQGGVLVMAGRDVSLSTASASRSIDEAQKHKGHTGGMSSKTITTHDKVSQTVAQATTLSGDTVIVLAAHDMTVSGSNVVSTKDTVLSAGNNISLQAADNTIDESHYRQEKTSGIMGTGGVGFTIGTRTQSIDNQSVRHSASGSTVGSTSGDVLIVAAKDFRQTGSDVLAPQGSIDIAAQRVDIEEARNSVEGTSLTSFRQTGISVALSSPVITAVQTAQQMTTAAAIVKDPRMQTLAVANVGMAGMAAYDAVQAGQGKTINGKDNQIKAGTDTAGNDTSRDANAADKVGGFTVSITVGSSSNSSKTDYASSTAVASQVNAGGDVRITAAGAGAESDLHIQGSSVKAGHAVTLQADDAITLQAASNTDEQHSKNKSSSANIGVAISSEGGIGFIASGSLGRGHADGSDLSWSNTHIEAGQIALASGGDTTLQGAVAKAGQVNATVGGKLLIESLQDTTHFDSKQQSLSGGVMIGTTVTGNANYAQSQIDSDYASVVEQSSIRAGDGGFRVQVAGDATLKGGAITSTQTAVEQGHNSFTTEGTLALTDIENRAQYKATAVSVSAGTGVNTAGKLTPTGSSIGLGKDGDSDASTTQAAISDIAGKKEARTGDKETGIAQIFNAGTVQKDIDAQVQITQIFSAQAPKLVASYAGSQIKKFSEQARTETDPNRKTALQAEAKRWEEGGLYRVALHITVGGLAGDIAGAAGAGTVAAAAPVMDALHNSLISQLTNAGVNPTVAQGAAQVVALITATAAGAVAGGGTLQGAAAGLNVDANNRQLHQSEYDLAKRYKKIVADKLGISQDEAEGRIARQIQRNVDSDTAQADGFKRDEPIISLMGCQLLKCDANKTDPYYKDSSYNSQLIASNQSTFNLARNQGNTGLTPQQITARNNAAGAPLAKVGAVLLGGYLLAPTVAAISAEVVAFTQNPVLYCTLNPAACIVAVDTVATTAAGVPVSGMNMPASSTTKALTQAEAYAAQETAALKQIGSNNNSLAAKIDNSLLNRSDADLYNQLAAQTRIRPDVSNDAYYLARTDQDILSANNFDMQHVLAGEINAAGKATGYHAEFAAEGAARIRPDATVIKNADGTYTAQIDVWDAGKNQWVQKASNKGESTFFPPSWSEARITYEASEAFKKREMISASKWQGTTPSGLRIEGYINPDRVTFFPKGR